MSYLAFSKVLITMICLIYFNYSPFERYEGTLELIVDFLKNYKISMLEGDI